MNERDAHHTQGPRGLIGRLMRRLYERVGFYPLVPLLPGFLVGAAGPITLALYFEMSGGEFGRILLAAELGIWVPELIVANTIVRAHARPLIAWIAGARGEEAATAAWRAGTTLPRDLLIHPLPYLVVATTALGFDFYAASELDLPAFGGGLVIFLGSVVQYAFWAVLRLFILEATLRPALEAVSEELPEGTHLEVPRMPLGRRLLISLPVMNLAAGTVLAGIFAGGEGTLGDFMLGVLGAVIVTLTISIWLIAFLSDSVASSMRDLRDGARRIGAGEFGGRVPIASTDETGELAQSFNEMAAGLAERERIREAFGIYVDRDVAEHILREGTSLAGEEVDVTMLFLDIRGFTTFAERLSAPEVVATLNRLFERIVPIIRKHSGHVDKYVGDGLLAVFGAPRRQEDHADQALAAALEIARAVEDEFGTELAVGIGLNSGPVVAGNVGGAGRLEFSVIGDAVNVAARVESATRQTGDRILIAGRTKELLRTGKITFVERPGLVLKGKTKPVEIYAPQADPGQRPDAVASGKDRDELSKLAATPPRAKSVTAEQRALHVSYDRAKVARSDANETARVREVQDKHAVGYDRQISFFERLLFAGGREWVCSQASGKVLELAAGTARNLPFYPPGVDLTAIELSSEMLAIARKRAQELGAPVDLRLGDAQKLDLPDERFDTVTCTLGFCTIPDTTAAAGEAFRVLRPGGRLLMLEHVRSPVWVVRAGQRLLEPLAVRFEADHLLREPVDYLPAVGFEIDEVRRSKWGIVERLRAHKPG